MSAYIGYEIWEPYLVCLSDSCEHHLGIWTLVLIWMPHQRLSSVGLFHFSLGSVCADIQDLERIEVLCPLLSLKIVREHEGSNPQGYVEDCIDKESLADLLGGLIPEFTFDSFVNQETTPWSCYAKHECGC